MHDTECTAGADLDEWVRNVSDNVNDEMNVSGLLHSKPTSDQGSLHKDEPISRAYFTENATKPIDHSVDNEINENKYQHVYVWNPETQTL